MANANDPHCRRVDHGIMILSHRTSIKTYTCFLAPAGLPGTAPNCTQNNQDTPASLWANSVHKRAVGFASLVTLETKDVSNVPIFFSRHIVNLVGIGRTIYLMNTFIKKIDRHKITGPFSPAIISQALWYHDCPLQGVKFPNFQISRNGEHRISNGKNGDREET